MRVGYGQQFHMHHGRVVYVTSRVGPDPEKTDT